MSKPRPGGWKGGRYRKCLNWYQKVDAERETELLCKKLNLTLENISVLHKAVK